MNSSSHFTIKRLTTDLYCIQENISDINPIYTNDPINLYLLLGDHTALLLDTGCGLSPLKPIVKELIKERELLVFNSHAHWDHVLGNHEFKEVYIHENEASKVSRSYDLSGSKKVFSKYSDRNYSIPPAENVKVLHDGEFFDLGDIKIEIIHAPGHSPGSICLLTDDCRLFTGDVAYYGDQFLPNRQQIPRVIDTLSMLIDLCEKCGVKTLYPAHQQTPCDTTLLNELLQGVKKIESLWHKRTFQKDFYAWEIKDPKNERFRYLVSRF